MTDRLHIGLVGAGRMGAFHARVLAALPAVGRVSIADVAIDHARATAQVVVDEVGGADIDACASADELVGHGIDALVVASPTPTHADLTIKGAEAGLPVFCEKPIALDLSSTNEAIVAVEQAGTFLQVGFQRRFDAAFVAARDRIAEGSAGQLLSARMLTHDPAPPPNEYLAASGGIFRDLHIHDFDSLRFVTGDDVAEVAVLGATLDVDAPMVDTTAIAMRMKGSGALVVATGSRRSPRGYDVRLELVGDRDAFTVGLDDRTPKARIDSTGAMVPGSGEQGWTFFVDRFDAAYRAQMAAFIDAVVEGASPSASRCTGDDARAALLIAMACERSLAEGGRVVRLDEIDAHSTVGA